MAHSQTKTPKANQTKKSLTKSEKTDREKIPDGEIMSVAEAESKGGVFIQIRGNKVVRL